MQFLRIPEERVGVLIGENRSTLTRIEKEMDATITVESEGGVEIEGGDPFLELRATEVVKAIGRGFSPKRAFALFDEENQLAILNVMDYATTDNAKHRLKGRVIGKNGRTRETIESYTQTSLAIYGKTIGIIGKPRGIEVAREAILLLLDGRSHATAYKFLKRNRVV